MPTSSIEIAGRFVGAVALSAALLIPAAALAQSSGQAVLHDFESTALRGPSVDARAAADKQDEEADDEEFDFRGANAFEVWEAEHRWFRLGFRAYGYNPAVEDNAALKLGPGVTVPLTTDFFMGIGMKVSFTASYNRGSGCINRGPVGTDPACPEGQVGGVDYRWKEPLASEADGTPIFDSNGNRKIDGSNEFSVAGPEFVAPTRRPTHVAFFSFTVGGNYEVTIPNLAFFRVVQPFIGGGVVVAWIYTYSDLAVDEFVLIKNPQNDAYDPNNVDPWSDQGPEVGGEVYGGFHINLDSTFRLVFELSYLKVTVPQKELNKATAQDPDRQFQAHHMDYDLKQFKFGGGFEFRF